MVSAEAVRLLKCGSKEETVVEVQQATFSGVTQEQVHVDMRVGRQNVVITADVEDASSELRQMLDRLAVKVQKVTFVRTQAGSEIRATLRVGERTYDSTWTPQNTDGGQEPALTELLDQLGAGLLENLHSALKADADPSDESVPEQNGKEAARFPGRGIPMGWEEAHS